MLCVLERELHRPAAVTDGARAVVDTSQGHAVQRGGEPLVELTDDLPGLDVKIVEGELGLVTPDVPE